MGYARLTHVYLYPDGHAVACYRETHCGVEIQFVEIHEKWITGTASVPQWNAGSDEDGKYRAASGRITFHDSAVALLVRKATSLSLYRYNQSTAMREAGITHSTLGIGVKGIGEINIDGPLIFNGREVCSGPFRIQEGAEFHSTFEADSALRHWGGYDCPVHKIHRLEKKEA